MTDQKRIGILTYHRAYNYGAVLQAFALQNQITRFGYDCEIVDFDSRLRSSDVQRQALRLSRGSLRKRLFSFICSDYLKRRSASFVKFTDLHLHLSEERDISRENLGNVLQNYNAVVCGSDQIWNPRLSDSDLGYFAPDGNGFLRIAYGVSIGKGWLGEYERPDLVRKSLLRFDSVSLRELSSIERLDQFCELSAKPSLVCDPTLLVDRDIFDTIASKRQVEGPFIFVYSVTAREETFEVARRLANTTGLPYYTMFAGNPRKGWVEERDASNFQDVSPSGFLAMIRDADYCITDSFHGTIFSLLYRKPFAVVGRRAKDGSLEIDERIAGLCNSFGIKDRVIAPGEVFPSLDASSIMDWSRIEESRQRISRESLLWLHDALRGLRQEPASKRVPVSGNSICPPAQCMGCSACDASCPVEAVRWIECSNGTLLPSIDQDECIGCGTCRRVCPALNQPILQEAGACYAAQARDPSRLPLSSSGGIATLLSENIVNQGGCVYGAAIDDDLTVRHRRVNTVEGLAPLRLSKYAHSEMGKSFRLVRDDLIQGGLVLFIGTPCQVAGLRSYLGKPYDNLLCVDIICHGAPPMSYLKQHIASLDLNCNYYSFRGGNEDKKIKLMMGDEVIYQKAWWDDEYYYAFMTNISLSECCYGCPFSQLSRVGDITLGDYRKLDRSILRMDMKGKVSLVLLNTERGAAMLRGIDNLILTDRSDVSMALPGNPNLSHPSIASPLRPAFVDAYRETGDFTKAFNSTYAPRQMVKERVKHSRAWIIMGKVRLFLRRTMAGTSGEPDA